MAQCLHNKILIFWWRCFDPWSGNLIIPHSRWLFLQFWCSDFFNEDIFILNSEDLETTASLLSPVVVKWSGRQCITDNHVLPQSILYIKGIFLPPEAHPLKMLWATQNGLLEDSHKWLMVWVDDHIFFPENELFGALSSKHDCQAFFPQFQHICVPV